MTFLRPLTLLRCPNRTCGALGPNRESFTRLAAGPKRSMLLDFRWSRLSASAARKSQPARAARAPLSSLATSIPYPCLHRLSARNTAIRIVTMAAATGGARAAAAAAADGERWWSADTVAVVTGANKGIGYAIARQLVQAGLTTIATARNAALGEAAVASLCKELGGGADVQRRVVFQQLDITDPQSAAAFAHWLGSSYGGLDILVNNAGFAHKGDTFGADEARTTIAINYHGTRAVTEALLPLLRPSPNGARIVNVSSTAGRLRIVAPHLQKRFTDAALTLDGLDALVEEFVASVRDDTYREKGWPKSMYGVSKLAETVYTAILARQLSSRPPQQRVFVNACHPGYVATDMSSHRGHLTPDQGADTPTFLALLAPSRCVTGGFYIDRKLQPFH